MEGDKCSKVEPGELESAIHTILDCYNKYYSKKFSLWKTKGIGKSKFREMLQIELNHMLTNTENRAAVDKMIRELDQNQDGVIDFDEYWDLIGTIVMPISRTMECEVQGK